MTDLQKQLDDLDAEFKQACEDNTLTAEEKESRIYVLWEEIQKTLRKIYEKED